MHGRRDTLFRDGKGEAKKVEFIGAAGGEPTIIRRCFDPGAAPGVWLLPTHLSGRQNAFGRKRQNHNANRLRQRDAYWLRCPNYRRGPNYRKGCVDRA